MLAGGGLIQQSCRKFLSDQDSPWNVTADDLLTVGGYEPSRHSLVIDVAPKRTSINFYEIKSIAGYSYAEWTPLMLTLERLFAGDYDGEQAGRAKQYFVDDECVRERIREFLYLTGGYSKGNWNWGGNSRTTAVLLWDNAWNYFLTTVGNSNEP
jgi:hypothetical protein